MAGGQKIKIKNKKKEGKGNERLLSLPLLHGDSDHMRVTLTDWSMCLDGNSTASKLLIPQSSPVMCTEWNTCSTLSK